MDVAWEVATAQRIALTCAWHTGRIDDLVRGASRAAEDARDRGDRYALTQLQTTVLPVVHLTRDDPAAASRELEEASRGLSRAAFTLQHWQHMQACMLVALYEGRYEDAWRRIEDRSKAIRRSFLWRIEAVVAFTRIVRASAALGMATTDPNTANTALRRAAEDARGLDEKTPGCAALIRAQIAAVRGERAATLTRLDEALPSLEREGARLLHSVAAIERDRLRGLTNGRARCWFESLPIARPAHFARILAPVFALERIS
jgi:hypothetical protein